MGIPDHAPVRLEDGEGSGHLGVFFLSFQVCFLVGQFWLLWVNIYIILVRLVVVESSHSLLLALILLLGVALSEALGEG